MKNEIPAHNVNVKPSSHSSKCQASLAGEEQTTRSGTKLSPRGESSRMDTIW